IGLLYRGASPWRSEPRRPDLVLAGGGVSVELVAAVCHEVGNLLAGARLLASERAPGRDGRIARSLGPARALVALVPSLLPARTPRGAPVATEPLDVLGGLWRGIGAADETRVRIELRSAVDLPSV